MTGVGIDQRLATRFDVTFFGVTMAKSPKSSLPRPTAILGGNRIPFARSNGPYAQASNQDMFTSALDGLVASSQSYVENTAVLLTRLTAEDGSAIEITDFAPRFKQHGRMFHPMSLVRTIRPLSGAPRVTLRLRPLGRRATVTDWDPAKPFFRPRYHHHALALEPLRRCPADQLMPAIAAGLKPGGQLVLLDLIQPAPATGRLSACLERWAELEGRSVLPAAPATVAVSVPAWSQLGESGKTPSSGSSP